MNASEMHEKALCREKKKVGKKNSPLKVKVYKTSQYYGKAFQKRLASLPNFLCKKREIVSGIAEAVGPQVENSMNKSIAS